MPDFVIPFLAAEEQPTDDGRVVGAGALSAAPLPLPVVGEAGVIGQITEVRRDPETRVWSASVTGPIGLSDLIERGWRMVGVDLIDVELDERDPSRVVKGRIAGAHLVKRSAWPDALIRLA